MSGERPIDKLLSLATAKASGEFVCAAPAGEIHVYLQGGRIAWATDSKHPFVFAAHLQKMEGIDVDTFRQVVEECRRERLRLGETLVKWGLTTWEGVRSSLSHQIERAISLLAGAEAAEALFLERAYAKYDERLTFDVRDFLGRQPVAEEPPAPKAQPSGSGTRSELARRLRSAVEGLGWVEVLDGDSVIAADPASQGSRVPAGLLKATILDDADFAAIRTPHSSVVGLSLSPPRSLWCRISADSTFGAVVSALWTVAGTTTTRAIDPPPPRPDGAVWSIGEKDAPCSEAMCSFMNRAHDVLGAVLLATDPAEAPRAGCGCSALPLDRCLHTARRRWKGLAEGSLPVADDVERELDTIGFYLKTMVSGEARLWCFGAEIDAAAGQTLWLFLDRRTSQGLGWAYLTALTRALSRTRAAAAP